MEYHVLKNVSPKKVHFGSRLFWFGEFDIFLKVLLIDFQGDCILFELLFKLIAEFESFHDLFTISNTINSPLLSICNFNFHGHLVPDGLGRGVKRAYTPPLKWSSFFEIPSSFFCSDFWSWVIFKDFLTVLQRKCVIYIIWYFNFLCKSVRMKKYTVFQNHPTSEVTTEKIRRNFDKWRSL